MPLGFSSTGPVAVNEEWCYSFQTLLVAKATYSGIICTIPGIGMGHAKSAKKSGFKNMMKSSVTCIEL